MGVEERAEDDDDYKVTWGTGIHSHEFGWLVWRKVCCILRQV